MLGLFLSSAPAFSSTMLENTPELKERNYSYKNYQIPFDNGGECIENQKIDKRLEIIDNEVASIQELRELARHSNHKNPDDEFLQDMSKALVEGYGEYIANLEEYKESVRGNPNLTKKDVEFQIIKIHDQYSLVH